jgi:hypothetical protein
MAAARVAAVYPLLLALGELDATGYSVIVPVAPVGRERGGRKLPGGACRRREAGNESAGKRSHQSEEPKHERGIGLAS